MIRALLVSYAFPPVGGAGVGRVLKFQKYLPDHGVDVSVLTVANPSVPVTDESLERDVRPETEVIRARTFEPGYAVKKAAWTERGGAAPRRQGRSIARRMIGGAVAVGKQALVPDPQLLWQPAAQAALARLLASRQAPDVVFISGPPFSQFLLAPLARLRPRTRVVLDYRDEWITYRTTYEMMGRLGAIVGGPMERTLLRTAHAVTTATDAFRDNLLESFPFLDPDRVITIPNGYDPDDFPAQLPSPGGDRFVITYAGTIFKLTSARGLLGAVRRLHERDPDLARLLSLRFIGRIVDTEADAFEGTEELGVERLPYMAKEAVTEQLARSHMTLCLLDDVPGNERIYPGKVFELMYLGRPCLTLTPPGALSDLATRHNLGRVLRPRDEAAIAVHLATALRAFRANTYDPTSAATDIGQFHRSHQAATLGTLFRSLVCS